MFKIKKRSRINYWSCSKFADWIRGTNKPLALEWEAWENWHKKANNSHPIRYWIADELLDRLQDFVNLPMDLYNTCEIYIRNRYIDKLQYLRTGLTPGEYHDLDTRILNGLFNELIDFVEIEQAHLMTIYKDRGYKFVNGRCPKAGLDYLEWTINLKLDENYGVFPDSNDYGKPTEQAKSAQKILKLYYWWKNRENRPDPHSLFSKEKDGKEYYRKINDLEQKYYKQDTKMLIKLIKIRQHLWT